MPQEPSNEEARECARFVLEQLRELSSRFPGQEPRRSASGAAAVIEQLLASGGPEQELSPRLIEAAAAAFSRGFSAGPAEPWSDGELYHPCIHVGPELSFYSFPRRRGADAARTGLFTVDSAGRTYPTRSLDPRLRVSVAEAERHVDRAGTLPPALQTPRGLERCLSLLLEGPGELPFRTAADERRLRSWCVLSYVYPLAEQVPLLRVVVPDVDSARNVEHLLRQSCFNALAVDRGDMGAAVRAHRRGRAGVVVFGPEVKTGRLPRCALEHLEHLPEPALGEPPVAFVELLGRFEPPRVPERWIVAAELSGAVPRVQLAREWPAAGCAVALAGGGELLRDFAMHPGGVAAGIHGWLFGAAAEDDVAASGAPWQGQLAREVEAVWAECVAERGDDGAADPHRLCNVTCLHERLGRRSAAMKRQLQRPGWNVRGLRARLFAERVVTFRARNLPGCLSAPMSAELGGRGLNGVEVPAYRLPPGSW